MEKPTVRIRINENRVVVSFYDWPTNRWITEVHDNNCMIVGVPSYDQTRANRDFSIVDAIYGEKSVAEYAESKVIAQRSI